MKKILKILGSALLLAALCFRLLSTFSHPAHAQTSPWQTTKGGEVRIAFAPPSAKAGEGPAYGFIEIRLKPGWKTYWANPGSSGMPPEISLDQKGEAEILFPAPHLFTDDKEWSFGYKNHVTLPFRIAKLLPGTKQLSGSVTVGLCETICLPEQFSFHFDLTRPADFLTQGQVKAALSALPHPTPDNFRISVARLSGSKLVVTLHHPESAAAPQIFLNADNIQFGVAEPLDHKKYRTQYGIPAFGSPHTPGQSFNYTAILGNGEAVSGTYTIKTE